VLDNPSYLCGSSLQGLTGMPSVTAACSEADTLVRFEKMLTARALMAMLRAAAGISQTIATGEEGMCGGSVHEPGTRLAHG